MTLSLFFSHYQLTLSSLYCRFSQCKDIWALTHDANLLQNREKSPIQGFFQKTMNFLHKSKVDPLTKTHFFCLVHVIPISHLSYPPGPLVVFWETPSRNFLFFWPGLISWLHRFLKSVVSFQARPSRVISMFSSGVACKDLQL